MQQQDFRSEFISRRQGKPGGINISIFRFVTSKNDPRFKLHCFVEGSSDVVFYSGIIPNVYKLKSDQVNFIVNQDSSGSNSDFSFHGKKSVIKMCDYVLAEFSDTLSRCKFIVDRDYDELDLEKYDVSDDVDAYVTVLPCYSFENYYFIDDNLKSVFKLIFGPKQILQYSEFSKILNDFLSESCEYNALKKLIVKFSLHQKYAKHISLALSFKEDVLNFFVEKDGKLILNLAPLKTIANTAQTLFSEINEFESKLLFYSYSQYCDEMKSDPLGVKGKLLFNLLIQFINFNSNECYSPYNLLKYSSHLKCPGLESPPIITQG